MQNNRMDEKGLADGVCRRCKDSSSVLFCIGKRIKDDCDHDGKGEKIHSGEWFRLSRLGLSLVNATQPHYYTGWPKSRLTELRGNAS